MHLQGIYKGLVLRILEGCRIQVPRASNLTVAIAIFFFFGSRYSYDY